MIRFVTPELEALFCEKSVQFGIFGAKIYSQYQTYGAQSGILDMWLWFDDTYVTGCVSRFGGLLTAACTPRADVEELAVFLESSRGCPSDDDCEYGVHATPENCIKHWATWLQQPAKEGI